MATYERSCEQCSKAFTAGRRHARFCSETCRSRAHRGKTPTALTVVVEPGKPAKVARTTKPAAESAAPPTTPAPTYDALEDQVRGSLTDANALGTVAGMAAIRVAQQIDRGGDSGSAVVSLSKELSRLVGEAKVEAAPKNLDKADDIAAMVNAKILRLVQ